MDDDYVIVEGFGMWPRRGVRNSMKIAAPSRFPCLPGHEDQFGYLMDAEGKLLPSSCPHIINELP